MLALLILEIAVFKVFQINIEGKLNNQKLGYRNSKRITHFDAHIIGVHLILIPYLRQSAIPGRVKIMLWI
jgi:hypothetical protein